MIHSRGAGFAIVSALLFGLSTPAAKLLLGEVPPLLLAGLLYAGSGLGLFLLRSLAPGRAAEAPVTRADVPWLAGAVVAGGILGPVLLMTGLRTTPAASASLLLNLEGVFTALVAWYAFRENFDRRIALGFGLITAGAVLLSLEGRDASFVLPSGALAIAGACLLWAIDNNLTQRVSGADPLQIAAIKGAAAGGVNLTLAAVLFGNAWPAAPVLLAALAVGFVGYGVSLALFALALRHLGTARTAAYFSLAPFFGAAASVGILRDPFGTDLAASGLLMGIGVWLHLTERHEHHHHHGRSEHSHRHVHDEHHRHTHAGGDAVEPHAHWHEHEPLTHRHPHYPDVHHRHGHDS